MTGSASFGEPYGDMFDHHTAVYEYAGGARMYALSRTEQGCYNNAGDVIMGTKGTCYLDRCQIVGENQWEFEGRHNNPYDEEQRALIEAVRTGEPINSGYHMSNSTMLAVLGQIACYTGKPVKWSEAAESDLSFGPAPEDSNFDTPLPSQPDQTGNYPIPKPGLTQMI